MDNDQLDLVHHFSSLMGPKMDKKLLKNCLIALTLLSDKATGSELKKIIAQL